jgi:hypothetical protein
MSEPYDYSHLADVDANERAAAWRELAKGVLALSDGIFKRLSNPSDEPA